MIKVHGYSRNTSMSGALMTVGYAHNGVEILPIAVGLYHDMGILDKDGKRYPYMVEITLDKFNLIDLFEDYMADHDKGHEWDGKSSFNEHELPFVGESEFYKLPKFRKQ